MEQEKDNLGTKPMDMYKEIDATIITLEKEVLDKKRILSESNLVQAHKERLNELSAKEKVLSAQYETLERELDLINRFTLAKVKMLEKRINKQFALAKFKLFDQQVNGEIIPCCETLYDGVPYNTSLNNGARINVGLDIIKTMSHYYGVTAPIFCDNAEAVTELLDTGGQQIRLYVSRDKSLTVKNYNNNKQEALW